MQSNQPLISILMPYYRLGQFLVEAVESVKRQTYQNWELLVVDDCSPEMSATSVLAQQTDPRIRLLRHDSNLGVSAARNTAASNSKGEYLLPLDSDDLLEPTYIEKMLRALGETGSSAAYSQVKYFGKFDFIYTPSTRLCDIFSGHYPCNTLLMKREVYDSVGGYKPIAAIEDTEFWISAIESGVKFAFVEEPLYLYRTHEDGLMRMRGSAVAKDFLEVLLSHHHSLSQHLEVVLEKWIEQKAAYYAAQSTSQIDSEISHLQSEYADLRAKYESLEKRVRRNEEMLASLPQLTRQLSYVSLKKAGLR
jgi:glycosyltransferase involved in cell wall biosynthesis